MLGPRAVPKCGRAKSSSGRRRRETGLKGEGQCSASIFFFYFKCHVHPGAVGGLAWLEAVAKGVVRSCSCSCSSSCSISAAASTERSIVPYNIRRWNQHVTGFPIVLLLLAGLPCISGKVNSLPANRSEEDPCRPVFTLVISSTRTSTCTSTRNNHFRNSL